MALRVRKDGRILCATTHVLPVNDTDEHSSNGTYCRCRPSITEVENGLLVTHYAYDGREFIEDDLYQNSCGESVPGRFYGSTTH